MRVRAFIIYFISGYLRRNRSFTTDSTHETKRNTRMSIRIHYIYTIDLDILRVCVCVITFTVYSLTIIYLVDRRYAGKTTCGEI